MVPIEPKDGTRAAVDWWVSVRGLTPTPPSEPLKPSTGTAVRDHRNAVRDRSEYRCPQSIGITVRIRRNPQWDDTGTPRPAGLHQRCDEQLKLRYVPRMPVI
jgi:hypothetical protein